MMLTFLIDLTSPNLLDHSPAMFEWNVCFCFNIFFVLVDELGGCMSGTSNNEPKPPSAAHEVDVGVICIEV